MSPLHSLSFLLLIIVIICILVGVHSALKKDTIERETSKYRKQIYIVTGVFCVLLVLGFLVLVSKSK